MPHQNETPQTPTRERRLYVASARVYADAFRAAYTAHLAARRGFRRAVASSGHDEAFAALWRSPDAFGSPAPGAAAVVRDPAFIYWTQRERRPRALLIRAADAIRREVRHREHEKRVRDAETAERNVAATASTMRHWRQIIRQRAPWLLGPAGYVYCEPERACRAILRSVRKYGSEATRVTLEHRPEVFGALLTVEVPRYWILIEYSTEKARGRVPSLLAQYDHASEAWQHRAPRAALVQADAQVAQARAAVDRVKASAPGAEGGLKEAARLIAILYRRRDVDDQPREGDTPWPPIRNQLLAMLPHAAEVIEEALQASKKQSGEDPLWIPRERDGMGLELGRRRGWDRGREHGRGGGLSL